MKRFLTFTPLLRVSLLGVILITLSGGCSREGDEVKQAGDAIRQHVAKQNPTFGAGRIRFSGTIDGAASDGVCACIQVCDSKGQNCTTCSCSPANCGKCD